MKIISGMLKGRNIIGYKTPGTRPTMDRIKESIFASIQNNIKESIVLDLFSGSGNYGIEAISNGSKLVYFNDYNANCIKLIKKQLEEFDILDHSILLNDDYLKCLKKLYQKNVQFDLIFLDPPYHLDIIDDIITYIDKYHLLRTNGLIIAEFEKTFLLEKYGNIHLIKSKKYGSKKVFIYKAEGDRNEFK